MKIKIAWIGKTKEAAIEALTAEYLKRISRYAAVEGVALRDEAPLLEFRGRVASSRRGTMARGANSTLVLMDSQGKEFSSEQFARFLRDYQDRNPDGFSEATKAMAQHTMSLGKITLPHGLARVVLLEQVYRALTILKGHPYHSGH